MLTFITDFRLYILSRRNFCHFTQYFSDHFHYLWQHSIILVNIVYTKNQISTRFSILYLSEFELDIEKHRDMVARGLFQNPA